jgi:hypothetical protein
VRIYDGKGACIVSKTLRRQAKGLSARTSYHDKTPRNTPGEDEEAGRTGVKCCDRMNHRVNYSTIDRLINRGKLI